MLCSFRAPSHPAPTSEGRLRWPRLFRQFFRFDKWILCRGLGCQADRQHALWTKVGFIGRHAVKARVRTAAIVKIEVASDRDARVRNAVVGAQLDLFVLHGSPKPLDKHVVPPSPFAIHADADLVPD